MNGVSRADLTVEEWDCLQRIHRGAPEATLVPGTIMERLAELGLAFETGGRRRLSEAGRRLILKSRDRNPEPPRGLPQDCSG